jgi:hypothetical protein
MLMNNKVFVLFQLKFYYKKSSINPNKYKIKMNINDDKN